MRFLDSFDHTIDDKDRLQIPAHMRDWIQAQAVEGAVIGSDNPVYLIAMPGDDQNIRLYTEKTWEELVDKLDQSGMDADELLEYESVVYGLSSRLEIDKQGRVRIPQRLRDLTGLGSEVSLVGKRDHINVCDRAKWAAFVGKTKENPSKFRELRAVVGKLKQGDSGRP